MRRMAVPRKKPAKPKPSAPKKAATTPARSAAKAASSPAKASNKPRPSRTGLRARKVVVDLEVNQDLRKRWQRAIDAVKDAKREGASAFDVLWETVSEIIDHDPPLYLAGGFATAGAFLTEHLGETERTARRWMRVARYASPAEEARYGVSKLDAVIAYIEAKSGGALQGRLPVAFEKLKIPVERDGKSVQVPLDEATVDAVEAATRKLRRAEKKPPRAASPALVAITRALSKGKLRGVSAKISGGKLMLGAVPLDALRDLADALRKIQLPATT